MNDPLAALKTIHAKRGYLLPHHGLMAISTPHLLERYDALYSSLTLEDRYLSRHDHEFIWLAILISCKESLGTHHVRRFLDAGGTNKELDLIMALSAFVMGIDSYLFAEDHWLGHLPGGDMRQSYLEQFNSMIEVGDTALAHMAACAIHICLGKWRGLRWQLVAGYEAQIDELQLAEAISLVMFPGSVPHYVRAAAVWQQLILENRIPASALFQQWASLSGQGGYNEASGVSR
ncbi:MAG: hypothetical protein P8M73_04810 [Luminiphilus sp.]|nr:hypothetical protein [Luminiphilus sp.]